MAHNTARAAQRAAEILGECELASHPYLVSKGFAGEAVNVWNPNGENVMVVPMLAGSRLIGCQLIDASGDKKFLFGQRSGGAQFVFGGRGEHYLCEGYATALSVRLALAHLKVPYTLHVTFSAGNMKKVAEALPDGFVIADNDVSGTGARVAQQIGWPFWMSDTVGEDFNDAHRRQGLFAVAMQLKLVVMQSGRRTE